jgi:hypothetical protein
MVALPRGMASSQTVAGCLKWRLCQGSGCAERKRGNRKRYVKENILLMREINDFIRLDIKRAYQ